MKDDHERSRMDNKETVELLLGRIEQTAYNTYCTLNETLRGDGAGDCVTAMESACLGSMSIDASVDELRAVLGVSPRG